MKNIGGDIMQIKKSLQNISNESLVHLYNNKSTRVRQPTDYTLMVVMVMLPEGKLHRQEWQIKTIIASSNLRMLLPRKKWVKCFLPTFFSSN